MRVQCLRRLGWRVDVMSLTIFISAMVQTVQMEVGVADVLRRQADDLRGRRREQALKTLAEWKDSAAIDLLGEQLHKDPDHQLRLKAVEQETGVAFRWRPFSVRAIMIEQKNIPFIGKPVKLAYMWR